MSKSVRVSSSIADAYRSMYATPNEDILNEELIDSLIEDVREEEIEDIAEYLDENENLDESKGLAAKAKKSGISVGTLRKVYNRGMAAWKTGHRPGTTPQQWGMARVNAFIVKKKKGNLNHDKDLAHIIHPDDSMLDEAYSKPMPLKTYADRVGINDRERQWIMDNEKDEPMYFPNDKFKSSLVLSYPVRDGDYYFSFLTDYGKGVNLAKQSNLKMNLLLQKEYKQALAKSKIDFKKEPEKLYALSGHLWNIMSKAFEKLPRDLGAGDTMTRDELYLAIEDLVGEAPQFESYDYQGETIQEGRLSGILATIANKIRSAKKKIGKRIKLGRKAKGLDSIKENESPKYDANILKSVADTYASMQNYGIQGDIVEETMDEALKPHEKIISKTFKTTNKIEIKGIDRLIDMSSIGVVQAMQKQNPRGFTKTVMNLGKLKEDFESLDEVKRQEVDAMKKVSKEMQKVLVSYQKIANMGDKELKDTKHNKEYKKVLDARDTILKMIGTLNTKMLMQKEELDNDDKPVVKKIVTMLKKASKKHAKQAGDLEKAVSEGKGKNFAQQAAIAIAKKKSGKYDKDGKKINASHCSEDLDEKVKDGKLDPLSKMGKSKLTGQEINKYYRDNPKQKAAARDKTVKKAIELALDLSGATNYAIKEIEKLKRGLSKNPAVKLALRHANESKEFTGHHVVIENLSPANMVKLKTYGKMMAKMTKLPFDENDPEKGIDKLMGQVWKQKHVPANWERLHKMVMMLKGIGVKMPSLKGKYMGLDPVTKKAIFYKEGTEEIVEWHQKIEDIKEGIEELVEKKEMSAADIKKIEKMTDRNDHTGSLMHLAKLLGDKKGLEALKGIMMTHKALGHMPDGLMRTRNQIYDNLMRQSSSKYSNHKDVISSF